MDLTPLSHSPRVSGTALTKTQWLKIYTGAREKEGKKNPNRTGFICTAWGNDHLVQVSETLKGAELGGHFVCAHRAVTQHIFHSFHPSAHKSTHATHSNKSAHAQIETRVPPAPTSSVCTEIPSKLRLQCSPSLSGWAGCELHWQLALGCAQPPFCSVQHHAPTRDWSN